jgi:anthranilate synthase component 2
MKVLLIDAYDSFVHIIADYLRTLELSVVVVRNKRLSPSDIGRYSPDIIVLGPGPGHPSDSGYVEIVRQYAGNLPILGVCLGHQAIGLAFGAKVARAGKPLHGKRSLVEHDSKGCFAGMSSPFHATRYHSLVVTPESVPADLIIAATSMDDSQIMALRHRQFAIESVQFHPESIYTDNGLEMFRNFISHCSVSKNETMV